MDKVERQRMILEDILKLFAKSSYWYGEDTGDYDFNWVSDDEDGEFFKDACDKIEKLFCQK